MGAGKGKSTLICVAQIDPTKNPDFVRFEQDYAEEFDRRYEECKRREREAEKKLRDFVITY